MGGFQIGALFDRDPVRLRRTPEEIDMPEVFFPGPEAPRAGMPFDRTMAAREALASAMAGPGPQYEAPEELGTGKTILGVALGALAGMAPGGAQQVSYNLFERPRELAEKKYQMELAEHQQTLAKLMQRAEMEKDEERFRLERTRAEAAFERDMAKAEETRRGLVGKKLLEAQYVEAINAGETETAEELAKALQAMGPARQAGKRLVQVKSETGETVTANYDPASGMIYDMATGEPMPGAQLIRQEPDPSLLVNRELLADLYRARLPISDPTDVANAAKVVMTEGPASLARVAPSPVGRRRVLEHMRENRMVPLGKKQQERFNFSYEMEERARSAYETAKRLKFELENRFGPGIWSRGSGFVERALGELGLSSEAKVLEDWNKALVPLYARFVGRDVGNLAQTEQENAAKVTFRMTLTVKELDLNFVKHMELLKGIRDNINLFAQQVWLGSATEPKGEEGTRKGTGEEPSDPSAWAKEAFRKFKEER